MCTGVKAEKYNRPKNSKVEYAREMLKFQSDFEKLLDLGPL